MHPTSNEGAALKRLKQLKSNSKSKKELDKNKLWK